MLHISSLKNIFLDIGFHGGMKTYSLDGQRSYDVVKFALSRLQLFCHLNSQFLDSSFGKGFLYAKSGLDNLLFVNQSIMMIDFLKYLELVPSRFFKTILPKHSLTDLFLTNLEKVENSSWNPLQKHYFETICDKVSQVNKLTDQLAVKWLSTALLVGYTALFILEGKKSYLLPMLSTSWTLLPENSIFKTTLKKEMPSLFSADVQSFLNIVLDSYLSLKSLSSGNPTELLSLLQNYFRLESLLLVSKRIRDPLNSVLKTLYLTPIVSFVEFIFNKCWVKILDYLTDYFKYLEKLPSSPNVPFDSETLRFQRKILEYGKIPQESIEIAPFSTDNLTFEQKKRIAQFIANSNEVLRKQVFYTNYRYILRVNREETVALKKPVEEILTEIQNLDALKNFQIARDILTDIGLTSNFALQIPDQISSKEMSYVKFLAYVFSDRFCPSSDKLTELEGHFSETPLPMMMGQLGFPSRGLIQDSQYLSAYCDDHNISIIDKFTDPNPRQQNFLNRFFSIVYHRVNYEERFRSLVTSSKDFSSVIEGMSTVFGDKNSYEDIEVSLPSYLQNISYYRCTRKDIRGGWLLFSSALISGVWPDSITPEKSSVLDNYFKKFLNKQSLMFNQEEVRRIAQACENCTDGWLNDQDSMDLLSDKVDKLFGFVHRIQERMKLELIVNKMPDIYGKQVGGSLNTHFVEEISKEDLSITLPNQTLLPPTSRDFLLKQATLLFNDYKVEELDALFKKTILLQKHPFKKFFGFVGLSIGSLNIEFSQELLGSMAPNLIVKQIMEIDAANFDQKENKELFKWCYQELYEFFKEIGLEENAAEQCCQNIFFENKSEIWVPNEKGWYLLLWKVGIFNTKVG